MFGEEQGLFCFAGVRRLNNEWVVFCLLFGCMDDDKAGRKADEVGLCLAACNWAREREGESWLCLLSWAHNTFVFASECDECTTMDLR